MNSLQILLKRSSVYTITIFLIPSYSSHYNYIPAGSSIHTSGLHSLAPLSSPNPILHCHIACMPFITSSHMLFNTHTGGCHHTNPMWIGVQFHEESINITKVVQKVMPHFFFSRSRIKIAMWKLRGSNTDDYCAHVCK